MNTLSFTGEMARLQQAIAESHDLVVCRGTVLEALNLRTSERVLEVGCGGGYLTYEAARFVGPTGRVCVIDISPDQIAAAQQRGAEFGWVECRTADIASPPYGDAEFDAVFAVQVLEYITDLDAALRQIHRMLRLGGGLSSWRRIGVRRCGIPRMAADAAGTDRMRAAYAVPKSAVYPGGAATLGGDPASPADRDLDPEHFL